VFNRGNLICLSSEATYITTHPFNLVASGILVISTIMSNLMDF